MEYNRPILLQEQRMKLSPQLYQTFQLMAMPVLDLKQRIEEEIEKNPALEAITTNNNISLDDIPEKKGSDEYFENSSDPGFISGSSNSEDYKRMFIEGALFHPESLQDHLLNQWHLQPISDAIFEIGELLIQNLNEDGFNREKPEILAKGYSKKKLAEAITLVQRLDPQGTCTKDFLESLSVQAKMQENIPAKAVEIIEYYFDYLEKGKYKELAKKILIKEEEVMENLSFIKTLNPFPGRQFSTEISTYVTPDLMITVVDNELVIKINEEDIPILEINHDFEDLRKDKVKKKDKEVRKFVGEKITEARVFIKAVELRNITLFKTVSAIASFQKDFFIKGTKHLLPLTLKEIAEEVGVHETTISRISTGKYIQTDWGIFELKFFFSSAMIKTDDSDNAIARESVKQILKEKIEEKGENSRLSDQSLADFLKNEKGIQIARRTVAKYRKELDIASSYTR